MLHVSTRDINNMVITLIRAKGPKERPIRGITTHSFVEAEKLLRGMSSTTPELGGADEIDYCIFTQEHGILFQGRLHLSQRHNSKKNLKREVLASVAKFAGQQPNLLGAKTHPAPLALLAQKSIWELHHYLSIFE
ncbi:MAG: hypothetical protein Q7U16_01960 [Agitococcus sp.]|nr:hypothetical protein [Agitococcus sp.]